MDSETQELIDYFLSESRETLQEVEPLIIQLDGDGDVDDETLAAIFRLFHSMKGTAGFLEFQSVERVTHSAETILQRLREGTLALDQVVIDVLCETLDFINDRLDRIEVTNSDAGAEPQADALTERLGQIVSGELREHPEVPAAVAPEPATPEPALEPAAPEPVAPEPTLEPIARGGLPEPASPPAGAGAGAVDWGMLDEPLPPELAEEIQRIGGAADGEAPEPTAPRAPPQSTPAAPAPEEAVPGPSVGAGETVDTSVGESLGLSMKVSPEIIQQYLGEAEDLLGDVEDALLALDDESASPEQVGAGYRALHSFKGNSGFLGFSDLESLAHTAEGVFGELKDEGLRCTPDLVAALLCMLDATRKAVQQLPDQPPIVADRGRCEARIQEALESARRAPPPPPPAPSPPGAVTGGDPMKQRADDSPRSRPAAPAPAVPEVASSPSGGPAWARAIAAPAPAVAAPAAASSSPPAVAGGRASPKEKSAPTAGASAPAHRRAAPKRKSTLRVDVEKLDMLMDLVGELIIGTTSVIHNPEIQSLDLESFQKSATQLNRITRDLQDVAMSLRMVPIDGTFRKMIRLVRDVSRKQGKKVHLEITGSETEVDKTVAEVISDPLVHMMRNAVDHGIEDAAERAAAGKSPEAQISLSARHQGGEIWIRISDDGRGIDREKILAKARERGLPGSEREGLSDSEVFAFIFEPGFSMAKALTDISGRGIGMDVVKRNIERVGGRVDIESCPGKGTTFTLRIPLTLAIIEGMLFRVGSSYFTIPLLQIVESVVLDQRHITALNNGQEVARIRERLIPVLRLNRFYGIESTSERIEDGIFLIVEDGDAVICLFIDELIGQRQTVVKSLSGYLGDLRGLSGCTVLGDGRISLIIDIQNLLQHHARRAA